MKEDLHGSGGPGTWAKMVSRREEEISLKRSHHSINRDLRARASEDFLLDLFLLTRNKSGLAISKIKSDCLRNTFSWGVNPLKT